MSLNNCNLVSLCLIACVLSVYSPVCLSLNVFNSTYLYNTRHGQNTHRGTYTGSQGQYPRYGSQSRAPSVRSPTRADNNYVSNLNSLRTNNENKPWNFRTSLSHSPSLSRSHSVNRNPIFSPRSSRNQVTQNEFRNPTRLDESVNQRSLEQPGNNLVKNGGGLKKLDDILSRLETTNEELMQELRHEKDEITTARRNHTIRHHDQSRQSTHQTSRHHDNRHTNPNHSTSPSRHQNRNSIDEGAPISSHGSMSPVIDLDPYNRRMTAARGRTSPHRVQQTSRESHSSRSRNAAPLVQRTVDATRDLDIEDEATVIEDSDYQDEQATQRTRSSVQHHLKERDAQSLRLASENVRYVMTNAQCSLPVRRCIDLSVNETIIGKKYWPRCAIVSRCGEESGCCYSPNHVCSVAEYRYIDLYFYYVTTGGIDRAGVDRLQFANHTRCECREKPPPAPQPIDISNDQPRGRDYQSTGSGNNDRFQPTTNNDRYQPNTNKGYHQSTSRNNQNSGGRDSTFINNGQRRRDQTVVKHPKLQQSQNNNVSPSNDKSNKQSTKHNYPNDVSANGIKSLGGDESKNSIAVAVTPAIIEESTTTVKPCLCPDLYTGSSSVGGACECVCDVNAGSCRRLMKGKRYFKPKDEKCILSGECGLPTCKFGSFLMEYKRCPRKREMKRNRNRPS